MHFNYLKLFFAVVLGLYFTWIAFDPMAGSFLDNVDLPVHETGHLIFKLFGEFLMVAGGSVFQVFAPAVFVSYFIWHGSYYSASIVLFWVGQSVLNVWVYAADAVKMQLVLTSGLTGSEGSFHDWNYMLTETGLIGSTTAVSGLIRMIGTFTIIAAFAASIYYSRQESAE